METLEAQPTSASDFLTHFGLKLANTAKLLESAYQIRHRVYCEDLGFEKPATEPLEFNAADAHSVHVLLHLNDAEKTPIGCVRVVWLNEQRGYSTLPLETVCGQLDLPPERPRSAIGEASRLAIVREYRRRKGDLGRSESDTPTTESRAERNFLLPTALMLGGLACAHHMQISHLYLLVEKRMAIHLRKISVIRQVGETVTFNGARTPYELDVQKTIMGLPFSFLPLWANASNATAGLRNLEALRCHDAANQGRASTG